MIVTHDLHANLSERLVEAADVLIGYTTNPHVDMIQRGEEAAFTTRLMLAGMQPKSAFIRLPLTPPSVTLLTAEGPYADMIQYGQRRMRESGGAILNVTILGGFVFGDTPKNGVAIVVTAREDEVQAKALAREIAEYGWNMRERFRRRLTPIADAVDLAQTVAADPALPAVIYSDAGDNPGGGGEGRTTWLLSALVEAGARRVYYGSFFDPALAEAAHAEGEGAIFEAVFNAGAETEFSKELRVEARVLKLTDGEFVGRLGIYQGRLLTLGASALLEIGGAGGIAVAVISARHQTADPMFFEQFGLDIAEARVVCVKSRGHFRAGFSPWFGPSQVHEIDTAGLTSPVLDRFQWKNLPRPSYPLDKDAVWTPPQW
ncbi:MAG: MlrC C-terminal domain-containing protein [Alphaproteobacteria bacterium]|nr:MlrC C-terminal domain-containing protein [Alphaproteobacteria bacterium]